MSNELHRLLASGIVKFYLGLLFVSTSVNAQMSGNPILPLYTADPDILYANGRYYIYPTASGPDNTEFHAFSSSDLTNWRDDGIVFNLTTVSWAKSMGWAPSVVARNGKYYFYYTAEEKIGVAVGDSPTGPFVDRGSRLVSCCGDHQIDPMAFIDTDGQAYLYYGNTIFNVVKLNSDMISTTGPISNNGPSNFFEAAYMVKRNGIYYLMYSVNDFRDDDYHVEYATASSPMGPWTTKGRISAPLGNIKGPGHNAVLKKPDCDEYYFVYHRRTSTDVHQRQVAIERMYFRLDGSIMPIDLTEAGVIARSGSEGCIASNDISNGTYRIFSKLTTTSGQALVLDIPECSTDKPADVRTWTPTSCLGQRWELVQDNGFYEIKSQQPTHYAMDLVNCSLAPGTDVKLWDDLNNSCQRWRIERVSPGWYRILAKGNGNLLDVAGCDRTPGANVMTWTWNGADCQLFRFESISATRLQAKASEESRKTATDHEETVTLSPNPTRDKLIIHVNVEKAGNIQLQLIDASNRTVTDRVATLVEGAHDLELSTSELKGGVYVLKIKCNDLLVNRKIMILK